MKELNELINEKLDTKVYTKSIKSFLDICKSKYEKERSVAKAAEEVIKKLRGFFDDRDFESIDFEYYYDEGRSVVVKLDPQYIDEFGDNFETKIQEIKLLFKDKYYVVTSYSDDRTIYQISIKID